MLLLVVGADGATMRPLTRRLCEAGHETVSIDRGEDAVRWSAASDFDGVVIGAELPGIDGAETCRLLRQAGDNTPVILVSAAGSMNDRIRGLDAGADDCQTGPVRVEEVLAHLRAVQRRCPPECAHLLRVGGVTLDVEGALAWREGQQVALTGREARVLEALMIGAGRVVTRSSIAEQAWDGTLELRSNVIDVHVRALRRKLDEPFDTTAIETVRGMGYRFRADGGR